ncbi:unnamed protein product, partial [Didymodactylos carnosus]
EDEDMLPVSVEAQQESGESTNDYALIDEALAAANSVLDQNIEDEEMLPVPVEAQQESGESTNDYALIDEALAAANSVLGNEGDDESQNNDFFPINNPSAPSTPVRRLNNPSDNCRSPVFTFRHENVRQQATNNILTAVQKKRKFYDEHLTQKAEQYKVGDCVGIKISEVDRTNTDVKLLPCLILSKEKKMMISFLDLVNVRSSIRLKA